MLFFHRMTPNSTGGSLRTASTDSFWKFGMLFYPLVIISKKSKVLPNLQIFRGY